MIYLTGDTHGSMSINKLGKQCKDLTKDDIVIILGDFGLLWKDIPDDTEKYWLDWLDSKPFTTLFLAGNHENYNRLNALDIVDMFGSTVGKVSEKVYMLRTGYIYEIQGKSFFVFGGAVSVDKHMRKFNVSWWPDEVPSRAIMEFAMDNLYSIDSKVDYVLTHCCGTRVLRQVNPFYISDAVTQFLSFVDNTVEFKKWFFGHYHIDEEYEEGKYICLFDTIYKLGE